MEHLKILSDLAIVGAVGAIVSVILTRFRLPVVAGLLAAGTLLGPHGFSLLREPGVIEALAEVGVILLLFTIGLEFSLERVRYIFRQVSVGGAVQVLFTGTVVTAAAVAGGVTFQRAVFLGFVFSMSSTAIVFRSLSERGELDAPHGRFIVGTLIFQDLCVVPFILMIPVLAAPTGGPTVILQIALALGEAAIIVIVVLLLARVLVPKILHFVEASRSREVFILSVLAIGTGTMWFISFAGLSVALGAFLGGMVIADTEFRHRAMGDMIPLRDAFVSIFFVSLGILFDVRVLLSHPLTVVLLLAGFVVVKGILATLAAALMRFPPRAAWLAGVGLAQFGEFGFVLLSLGESHGLIGTSLNRAVLNAGIISMFLTPLFIRLAPGISAGERVLAPLAGLLGVRSIDQVASADVPDQHVVVIGYGLSGQSLAHALAACDIPYLVLELNAEIVRTARRSGERIYHADATSAEALAHAHAGRSRAVAVLINDPTAAERVAYTLRREAPTVPVIMRTRYFSEMPKYERAGASDVVIEEIETAVEVIAKVLRRLNVPGNVIVERIRETRHRTMSSARALTLSRKSFTDEDSLTDLKIETFQVGLDSFAAGRSVADLAVRTVTGALVIAVRRKGVLLENPDPRQPLAVEDLVYLAGSGTATRRAMELLSTGK
jgi:CPA2 family monovalent cation:H+ antiporter-2